MICLLALFITVILLLTQDIIGKTLKDFKTFWIERKLINIKLFNIGAAIQTISILYPVHVLYSLLLASIIVFINKDSLNISLNINNLSLASLMSGVFKEEIVFRFPWLLINFGLKKIFNIRYDHVFGLCTSLIFGLAHLGNFSNFNILQIFMVTSQIFAGMIIWYIAIKHGFHWAVIYHEIYDFILWLL